MGITPEQFRELERRLASKERRAAASEPMAGCVLPPSPSPVSSVSAKSSTAPEPSIGLASLVPELQAIHAVLGQVKALKRVTVRIKPLGAPRQSRRDAWKPRQCVLRYRQLRDAVRAAAGAVDQQAGLIIVRFFLPVTPSWSQARKARALAGGFHKIKPDTDNLYKAFSDALFQQDGGIHSVLAFKVWCPAGAERIEATIASF